MSKVSAASDSVCHEDESLGTIILEAINSRHSVSPKRLRDPGPGEEQLMQIVAAAAAAPDHGRMRPFRIIRFPNETREALADVFETALLERLPDADCMSRGRAREKAARAPVLLGLVLRLREAEELPHKDDQIAAAGASLQNMLLAAHAMGFGARALSGKAVRTEAFRKALGLADNEAFLCFVPIGTPTKAPHKSERPDPENLLSDWEPKPIHK